MADCNHFGFTRVPYFAVASGMLLVPSTNWFQGMRGLRHMANEAEGDTNSISDNLSDLMTLAEIARIVGRAPNTIRNRGVLGTPVVAGGGRSNVNRWHYLEVKAVLEAAFRLPLPDLTEAKMILSHEN
jgi:hypothetical protein